MSIEIPEEIKKQWRKEFEKLLLKSFSKGVVQAEIDSDRWDKEWEFFLFAKTSSYEREQKLQDIINDICDESPYDFSQYCMSIRYEYEKEITKRDELINTCKPWVESVIMFSKQARIGNPKDAARLKSIGLKIEQWIKDVEELRL